MGDPILRMVNISKHFPGVSALKNVDFSLNRGEVHVLLGLNGAGKSTLMNILYGAIKPDSGDIFFENHKVKINSPKSAEILGIAMVHQDPGLVPDLNTVENIFLGREILVKNRLRLMDWKKMQEASSQFLQYLGAEVNLAKKVKDMNMTEKQFVSIARVLAADPQIIIFDEPTASLTDVEISRLFELLRELKARGKSIIYISHRLKELNSFSDRVSVLKDGEIVATQDIANIELFDIVKMMLGKDIKEYYPKLPVDIGEVVLRVSNLFTKTLKNISFELHKGEILGVAGLVGSGRTNLARTIFGLEPLQFGKIFINGREKRIKNASDAISSGIGFVSENRNEHSLFKILSVSENTTIASLGRIAKGPLLSLKKERFTVKDILKRLGVKNIHPDGCVLYQSDGNKQKVILARSILSRAKIFVFDEPTQGLDVQSKVEAYNLMNDIIKNGGAILMISSDISELVGMSNRIIVLNKGQLTGEFDRSEATQEKIYYYAAGG